MAALVTKRVRTAAKKAALRTAAQTAEAGLGLLAAGGVILGASDVLSIDWTMLASATAFVVLNSALAGARSYLSIIGAGVPAEYARALPAASADSTSN